MSYNNYVDADAARRAAADFDGPAVAIIKHANPCGIAVGTDVAEAHRKAHACDPVSAFGGVIAANVPVSVAMAEQVAVPRRNLVPKPASLSFEEAACLPTAWLTAYRMLFTKSGLRPGQIDRIHVFFPDPWPKLRHHKRRLMQAGTVSALARVMRTGAELRFVSDHAEYFADCLATLQAHPDFALLPQIPRDWPATAYERKAIAAGRTPQYLRAARLQAPVR